MPVDYPYFGKPGLALLVVEDPDDRALIEAGFRSRGWQVCIEQDIGATLDLLVENWPRMIVTDALEFVELLSQAYAIQTPDGPGKEGPPVYFVAADEEEFVAAYQAGADMAILHPIDVDAFFTVSEE